MSSVYVPVVRRIGYPSHHIFMVDTPAQEFGQFMEWDGKNLLVDTDDPRAKKLRKKALSPSTSNAFALGCPARWVTNQLLPRDNDPMSPAAKGTASHSVMEDLFTMDPPQRTKDAVFGLINTIEQRRGPSGTDDVLVPRDPIEKLKWSGILAQFTSSLWDVMDPSYVGVHSIERHLDAVVLHGVPFNGYIDLQTTNGIIDWKFPGKKPREYSPNSKIIQEYHEQLRIYAMAVHAEDGVMPGQADLVYPNHSMSIPVDLGASAMDAAAGRFTKAWSDMNSAADSHEYPAVVNQFCGWCPLASVCPSALDEGKTPKTDAYLTGVAMNIPTAIRRTMVAANDNEGSNMSGNTQVAVYAEDLPYRERMPVGVPGVQGSTLNMNSYKAMGISGYASSAFKVLRSQDKVTTNAATTRGLAHIMFSIESFAQSALVGQQSSHNFGLSTRIRGFLHTYVEEFPPPFGSDASTWTAWATNGTSFVIKQVESVLAIDAMGPGDFGIGVMSDPANSSGAGREVQGVDQG